MTKFFALLLLGFIAIPSLIFAQVASQPSGKLEINNESIWSGKFKTEYVYAVRSMNDGEHFSAKEKEKIVKYSYSDFENAVGTIYDGASHSLEFSDYFFNADETKILLATETQSIYRRSFTANYYVIDLATNKATLLFEDGPQMLADFSPDGSKVAFVFENNIYVKNLADNKLTQITTDGKTNGVINGSSDWVYEEEFSVTKAFYWSPLGTKIAYLKFDESDVKDFTMSYYRGETYPNPYTFKYPKAGEDNSKLSLYVHTLTGAKTSEVNIGSAEYVPRMTWTNDDNKLIFLTLNRHQNELSYVMSNIDANGLATGKVFYTERSDTYVEIDDNLIFLEDGESFLRTSEKSGYNHIYKVGFDGAEAAVTKGNWDVIDLKGVDNKKGIVYYTSAEEGAMYKALYSIRLDGKKQTKLSLRQGYNDAEFSTGMKYYMNYYSNANEAFTISVHNAKGKELSILKDNATLNKQLAELNIAKKEFITIKGATEDLNAWIIKPTDFDATKKYPIYFNIYNGPGANTVKDSWGGNNFMYHQLLAKKGYIIISLDTRGTMYRGTAFKKSTYLQLGKLETEDMIAVAKNVGAWDYADEERIGVMGWSYGGYMASLCMTKGADVFKMGIAVAPVTNWRWYDNIYTERFMRTPQENPDGYDDNSPINHIGKMKGKYLLVHGSGDDNVHVQNSMEMINALVEMNVDFEMFIYTNKNHGIYGGKTREHLFNKLLRFTEENL